MNDDKRLKSIDQATGTASRDVFVKELNHAFEAGILKVQERKNRNVYIVHKENSETIREKNKYAIKSITNVGTIQIMGTKSMKKKAGRFKSSRNRRKNLNKTIENSQEQQP